MELQLEQQKVNQNRTGAIQDHSNHQGHHRIVHLHVQQDIQDLKAQVPVQEEAAIQVIQNRQRIHQHDQVVQDQEIPVPEVLIRQEDQVAHPDHHTEDHQVDHLDQVGRHIEVRVQPEVPDHLVVHDHQEVQVPVVAVEEEEDNLLNTFLN